MVGYIIHIIGTQTNSEDSINISSNPKESVICCFNKKPYSLLALSQGAARLLKIDHESLFERNCTLVSKWVFTL